MSVSIAVVCESPVDRETVSALVDRLLCERVEWIESDSVDSFRGYRGVSPTDSCLCWEHVPSLASAHGIKFPGKFTGLPRETDTAYRALVLLLLRSAIADRPHAVLLVRDSDRDESRAASLARARDAVGGGVPIVIGVAHTKRECWVLAAFEPFSDTESELLEGIRKDLGFDPRLHSHDLTAKHSHDKLSAKRVLGLLTGGQRERELHALWAIPLDVFVTRGQENGCASFVAEIETRLLPLFDPRPAD